MASTANAGVSDEVPTRCDPGRPARRRSRRGRRGTRHHAGNRGRSPPRCRRHHAAPALLKLPINSFFFVDAEDRRPNSGNDVDHVLDVDELTVAVGVVRPGEPLDVDPGRIRLAPQEPPGHGRRAGREAERSQSRTQGLQTGPDELRSGPWGLRRSEGRRCSTGPG